MRAQAAQTPQASDVSAVVWGFVQFSAWATDRAASRLPTPDGPGENQARRQRSALDRSREQIDQPAMTDDVRNGVTSTRVSF
jgi:hypothetical protein